MSRDFAKSSLLAGLMLCIVGSFAARVQASCGDYVTFGGGSHGSMSHTGMSHGSMSGPTAHGSVPRTSQPSELMLQEAMAGGATPAPQRPCPCRGASCHQAPVPHAPLPLPTKLAAERDSLLPVIGTHLNQPELCCGGLQLPKCVAVQFLAAGLLRPPQLSA